MRRSVPTARASAVSGARASSWARRPASCRSRRQPTSERLFVTRLLTAAALIAALLGALFWLDRPALCALVGLVVVLAGQEWASLAGIRGAGAWAYGAACAILFLSLQ